MVTRLMLALLCLCLFVTTAEAGGRAVYRGTWRSQSTGHSGPMRARITPRADGNYDARFTGRFMLVIPFTYRVQLNSQGMGAGGQSLWAYKQLGPIVGSYSMSAQMNGGAFSGFFRAAGDTGSVSMRRVR